MQSNCSAGIITYRETKMPQVLSTLALPKLEDTMVIGGNTEEIKIYFIDCPVNGDKIDKKRYRLLRDLIDRNKINFLVERFDASVQSNVSPKKNELHYAKLLEEVKALKQLAAIIKLSQDRNENLLTGNIGFIMGEIDSLKIDYLSEEASNIMLYEGPFLNDKLKAKLHNDFMEKKGVSIIFTKDLKSLIKDCSIISITGGVDLEEYLELIDDKIVLGKSATRGLRTIDNIKLWGEEIHKTQYGAIPSIYNDEILAIVRYYNIKLDIIEFIKKFPYIYFD